MNILYLNHYAGGPKYGMEYRPYYLAREWVRAGHDVTIVAASYSHVRNLQPTVSGRFTEELVDGVRFVWCSTPSYTGNGIGRVLNIFSYLGRLFQYSTRLAKPPNIVIASSTYPLDIHLAKRIARKHGAKVIWEVHDLWPLSPIELGGISPHHPLMMLFQHAENTACRDADVVVSMLPLADDHLKGHGMAPSKFVYVPNGIDPAEWAENGSHASVPAPHRSAISTARAQGRLLVAYVGAHGVANALDSLLDAAALLRGEKVTVLLVGGGSERERLRRRVADEKLDHVQMLEPVPKAVIPSLLRSIDILYIGLRHEPLFRFGISPNKLMDYMMAARPIISSIDAGNDPVAEARCGISTRAEDPVAIANAVRAIAALSPAERESFGTSARRFVELNNTYPVLARRFLEVMRGGVRG